MRWDNGHGYSRRANSRDSFPPREKEKKLKQEERTRLSSHGKTYIKHGGQ